MILMQNMPSKYNALLNILNTKKNLTWDKIFSFLQVKETKLLNIGILTKKTAYYASRDSISFQEHGSYQGRPESRPKSRPSAQARIQFPRAPVKYYVY